MREQILNIRLILIVRRNVRNAISRDKIYQILPADLPRHKWLFILIPSSLFPINTDSFFINVTQLLIRLYAGIKKMTSLYGKNKGFSLSLPSNRYFIDSLTSSPLCYLHLCSWNTPTFGVCAHTSHATTCNKIISVSHIDLWLTEMILFT